MEYSNEELNYFRICYMTTNLITEGLRSVFKQEWNTRYHASLGDWQDTAKSGMDFYNQETPPSKRRNARLLTIMRNGNTKEWDCTALFFGILYFNSIGASLNTAISNHVDDLRVFRNEVFAHVLEGRISNIDFQRLVGVVETAFTGLNLAVDATRAIANQKDFPTEEVRNLKIDMQVLKEERDVLEEKSATLEKKSAALEKKSATFVEKSAAMEEKSAALEEELKSTPKSFLGALPPKPSHVIQKREQEVSRIIRQLKDLSENSDGEVTTMYLSGNPGCGKSQLAREVGEEIYRQESSDKTFFVSTLNAEYQDAMVRSYSTLARALGCTEYAVTRISTSKDVTVEQKLEQFSSLVAPKMKDFSSWLLIVDGVVDLTAVRKYWPASGSKEYGAGNIIVTTQDQSAIPECCALSRYICLSKGMQVGDAVSLLSYISQMTDKESIFSVAEALDRQPLVLACAALYVQSVRSHGSPNFTWKDYLDKLNKGKEIIMGEVKKCDMGYSISMPIAVEMAVNRATRNEEVLFYFFQLLSVCAPSPIPLENVVQYVSKRTADHDNEEIRAKLTHCSLLNFDPSENTLCFHQVLHRVIKADENLYLSTERAFEVIVAAFEPIKSMADEEGTRRKLFVEHVNCFLQYVNKIHSTQPNFYDKLRNFTELSLFFDWLTSCAINCLKYGKMTVVKQCLENVCFFIEEHGCMGENSSVDDSLSSRLLFFCGYVLCELCDYSNALKYFNKSMDMRRKIHGKTHTAVAACLMSSGNTHERLCHYTKAITCYDEALSIYRQLYGERNDGVADCLVNLGNTHFRLCHLTDATACLKEALSINRELCGEKDDRVATCLLNLGIVSHYEQAEGFRQQALCIRREVYGENHPRVAECLHGLARVHLHFCRFNEAKDLFEQCLPIFNDVGDQYRVGLCLHNLGLVSERLHDMETAAEFFTRALETRRRFLPETHPHVKNSAEELHRVTRNMAAAKQANVLRSQRTEQKKPNERQEEREKISHENDDFLSTRNMAASQRFCPKCILL